MVSGHFVYWPWGRPLHCSAACDQTLVASSYRFVLFLEPVPSYSSKVSLQILVSISFPYWLRDFSSDLYHFFRLWAFFHSLLSPPTCSSPVWWNCFAVFLLSLTIVSLCYSSVFIIWLSKLGKATNIVVDGHKKTGNAEYVNDLIKEFSWLYNVWSACSARIHTRKGKKVF